MTEKTYREALTDALFLEMGRDENVIVMGEDVVGGTGSPYAEPVLLVEYLVSLQDYTKNLVLRDVLICLYLKLA